MFMDDAKGWKLITVDENKPLGRAPKFCQQILQSATFHLIVMGVNLSNAILACTIAFKHDGRPRDMFYAHYYLAEVGFTLCFDLEVIFKVSLSETFLVFLFHHLEGTY